MTVCVCERQHKQREKEGRTTPRLDQDNRLVTESVRVPTAETKLFLLTFTTLGDRLISIFIESYINFYLFQGSLPYKNMGQEENKLYEDAESHII